jgi:hypothetical protein
MIALHATFPATTALMKQNLAASHLTMGLNHAGLIRDLNGFQARNFACACVIHSRKKTNVLAKKDSQR